MQASMDVDRAMAKKGDKIAGKGGKVTGLTVSTDRNKKIRFARTSS